MRVAGERVHGSMTWVPGVVVVMTLALVATGPLAAQEGGEAAEAEMEESYDALREAVKQEEWAVARESAVAAVQAGAEVGWDNLNAEQLYMMGVAYYYLMGMAFRDALDTEELSEQRAQFARKMRNTVFPPEPAVKVISHGERVNIEDHVVAGKITIMDFSSEFCGPCVAIGPYLEALAGQREDIAVVKVDINRPGVMGIDFRSPVAQQYQIRSIPHFMVYDAQGNLRAEGREAYEMVLQWLQAVEQ